MKSKIFKVILIFIIINCLIDFIYMSNLNGLNNSTKEFSVENTTVTVNDTFNNIADTETNRFENNNNQPLNSSYATDACNQTFSIQKGKFVDVQMSGLCMYNFLINI